MRSVNVDLIYGLPRQTPEGFARTLDTVIAARPDRIALYGYAHLPELFKPQRRIDAAELPDARRQARAAAARDREAHRRRLRLHRHGPLRAAERRARGRAASAGTLHRKLPVARVTDGSAVLGLGNIGPAAAMPVMEGKAALFKQFGGVDAWPVVLDTQDTD